MRLKISRKSSKNVYHERPYYTSVYLELVEETFDPVKNLNELVLSISNISDRLGALDVKMGRERET